MAEAATKLKTAAPSRQNKPRPAYVLVNLPDGVSPADIEVVSSTRKAEEALEAIDSGDANGYLRLMIK